LCFMHNPRTRQRAHAWLMYRFGAVGESAAAAAGIAGLIGSASPQQALAQATIRFRSVYLYEISYEDLLASPLSDAPPDLYSHTVKSLQGECDAFISHSWHDCAEVKWLALQRWRSTFISQNGREPLVWLDKYCIDQSNIEADLRCLPIFLNGCKELVILCGTTYMERLWCVMELFVFAHMKGELDRIKMFQLYRSESEQEDSAHISNAIATFDVRQCVCFKSEDKERMFAVIGAAFGNIDRFNEVIHELMGKARL